MPKVLHLVLWHERRLNFKNKGCRKHPKVLRNAANTQTENKSRQWNIIRINLPQKL